MTWRESSEALLAGDFRKLFEAFSETAGATLAPGVAPGEAHLVGKSAPSERPPEAEPADPLDLRLAALEREIERRRGRAP